MVIGHSGMAPDEATWAVRGFMDEKQAKAFARRCESMTTELAAQQTQAGAQPWEVFRTLPEGFIDPKAQHIDSPPSSSVESVFHQGQ